MDSHKALFFVLSDKRLLKGNGEELTEGELRKLWEFYNMMSGSPNSRFIFRGESDRNLMNQFNADTDARGTDTVLNTKLLEQKESSFNNNYLLKIYMRSIQSLLGKHITTGYLLRYK